MKNDTSQWVAKAEDDFRLVELVLTGWPGYDVICFHAQQCAEKYLKAFLIEHDVPFPLTHVLVDLQALCLPLDTEFGALQQDLEDLTVYGVRVRYPGFDATLPDAEEAFAAASRVRALVRGRLGLT